MKETKAVWAKGRAEEMNRAFAFALDLKKPTKGEICLSSASCYKLYADGKLLGFGPNRASHGYCRFAVYKFEGQEIVAEVLNVYAQNFCWVKQKPFFACEVKTENGEEFSAEDFACFELTDRVQKVQRYSFQRGFAEVYELSADHRALYLGDLSKNPYPRCETEEATLPKVLPTYTENPLLEEVFARTIDFGAVKSNEKLPVWTDRSQTDVGKSLEGFTRAEWQSFPTDEVSKFEFFSWEKDGEYLYETVDFSRIYAGITELTIDAENAGELFVTFDEILTDETKKELNPFRGETANVFKWSLKNAGKFSVSSFEPYAYRYARIVTSKGICVKIKMRTYENPEAKKLAFSCADGHAERIMEAARNTFAQNAVDLLSDCPSRERAGWLSDSYFSSVAEWIFTGENKVERAFLENFVYANKNGLPEGMIPRCYPADYYEKDGYIPNWAMWYILELNKYFRRYGRDEIIEKSRENVEGLLRYFASYENEYGVLENLRGWVFVEWSEANEKSHIRGVNVPSNACYYATLLCADEIYNIAGLKERAKRVRDYLLAHAYRGGFFVDNLVRNAVGALEPTENYTETCQYYMFFFRVADKTTNKELFYKILNEYGKCHNCANGKKLAEANMIYGVYMRLELLMREGRREELYKECFRYFYEMTEKTGTLWEHNGARSSCDHGFASYVAKFLIYALTGYDVGIENSVENAENTSLPQSIGGIGIPCSVTFPSGKKLCV